MFLDPNAWRNFFSSFECYLELYPWGRPILQSAAKETQNLNRTRVNFSRDIRIGLIRFLTQIVDMLQEESRSLQNKLSDCSMQAVFGLAEYDEYTEVKKNIGALLSDIKANTEKSIMICEVISKITMMANAAHEE
jgi:hypothetical protein